MRSIRWPRYAAIGLAAATLGVLALLWVAGSTLLLTPRQVRMHVDRLNEQAAVTVPHFKLDRGTTRRRNAAVFERAETGQPLSDSGSSAYRVAYQELLRSRQAYLRRFDRNLTVLTDVRMASPNNVQGHGIDGAHDHHDASARSNYADLRSTLKAISSAGATRPWRGVMAYKDLRDILLHLATAPQTKSVPHEPQRSPARDTLDVLFESVLSHFKAAQFAPVNSSPFREQLHLALDSYDAMVLLVQDSVAASQSRLARGFTGTFKGWQSLGPDVEGAPCCRFPRSDSTSVATSSQRGK